MSLEHEFYLIPISTDLKGFWSNKDKDNSIIDKVVIYDDIIQYISDTLEWIPSKNPAKLGNPIGQGINYYGVTLFDNESSIRLKSIITSWRDLFNNAPDTLFLTGNYVDGDNELDGGYDKIVINRDEVIKQFNKIIAFAECLSKGHYYLYHLGI
jgi:hypothetical protein